MRRAWMLIPFVIGCAKTETKKVDSAAMAPPMPAALTDADIAGTWKGTAMLAGTDSVISRWTQICAAGTCRGTAEGQKDTIPSTYTLMADSAMGKTQPYSDPAIPKVKVIDQWTFRLKDGKGVGTGMFTLASKPDSVVMRYRFEGSRTP
jgi:hypothetical protein